jgi:hypothetical protein
MAMPRLALVILVCVLASWILPGLARAQAPIGPLYIVLVIDDSGSMADNDAQNLRVVAAKLIISLLEPGDQVAVVRFSTDSQVLVPFTPLDPDARQQLVTQLAGGFASEGRTDIQAALDEARALLADTPAGRGRVIFLTDGLPAPAVWESTNPTAEELEAYVAETLRIAKTIGHPVLSVALGDQVDRAFLSSISRTSGGHTFAAVTALDLPAVYLEMLAKLQDRTIVGPGLLTAPAEVELDVHPYARRVGFVVVKDPGVTVDLRAPDAAEPLNLAEPGIAAFREPQFEILVVPDIPAGPWRVVLGGAGRADVKAIIINSRLQLALVSPSGGAACTGTPWPIGARLNLVGDNGGLSPIAALDAPETVKATVSIPDGQVEILNLGRALNTDQYTADFERTDQPGTYAILLQTDAAGLDVRHTTEVAGQACPGLAIVGPPDTAALELRPGQPVTITARLVDGEGQPLDEGHVTALVTDTAGNQNQLPLSDVGRGQFQGEFQPVASGPVEIRVVFEGAVWQGLPVQFETESVRLTVTIVQPDIWHRLRPWLWIVEASLVAIALLLVWHLLRQPKLDGELVFAAPGARPMYEPVRGRDVRFGVEGGLLTIHPGRRGVQALLRAERQGDVRLLPLNGARLTKNHLPVRPAGSLIGPRDVIRLAGLEIQFESYREE